MRRNLGARWRWQRSMEHGDSRRHNIVMPELPELDRACEDHVARSISAENADDRGYRLGRTAESVEHRQHSVRRGNELTR